MNPIDLSNILNNILTAIYSALGIITVLGAAVVWLISQRFLSKKSFGQILAKKEDEMKELEKRIITLEEQRKLAEGPIGNLQLGISEIKEQVSKLTDTVNAMNVKLAVLDQAEKDRKAHRRGGQG